MGRTHRFRNLRHPTPVARRRQHSIGDRASRPIDGLLQQVLGAPGSAGHARDVNAASAVPDALFETYVQFSRDGRWIAYQSGDTRRAEVYVMPYPGPGPSRQISAAGGTKPRWRGFVAPDGRIGAAEMSVRNGVLESGEPQMLFNPQVADIPPYQDDVSADGQRILAITPRAMTEGLTIVQNWPALVKP